MPPQRMPALSRNDAGGAEGDEQSEAPAAPPEVTVSDEESSAKTRPQKRNPEAGSARKTTAKTPAVKNNRLAPRALAAQAGDL